MIHQYASKEDYLRDVPRLIIENNLHGIDIDPRAVQIAGLSLWLRAQKAWQARGVKPADRPRVRRSNIVCAEPMPGSPEMLEEFVATLKPDLLGELVKTVFDKMQLAGEAGSLLKIEEEIRTAIDTARKEWLKQQDDLLTRKDGSQEEFFDTAEQQVIDALRAYAEQADADSYQRRLFADDAARGFAFIDLCRKRYDAVVMNPPFGECADAARSSLSKTFPLTYKNIFGSFIERAIEILSEGGRVGSITSRTFLFLPDFEGLRSVVLGKGLKISTCTELGEEVLDNATVRVAAAVLTAKANTIPAPFSRLNDFAPDDKPSRLLDVIENHSRGLAHQNGWMLPPNMFESMPGNVIAYTTPPFLLRLFAKFSSLQPNHAWVRRVPGTGDNDVSLRLRVEVSSSALAPLGRWCAYAKGGGFSPFFGPPELVIECPPDQARLIHLAERTAGFDIIGKPQSADLFGTPALTFSYANDFGLDMRPLPAGSLFDSGGPAVFAVNKDDLKALGGFLTSRVVRRLLFILTPERFKQVGLVQALPIPSMTVEMRAHSERLSACKQRLSSLDELCPVFWLPICFSFDSLGRSFEETSRLRLETESELWDNYEKIDRHAFDAYGLSPSEQEQIKEEIGRIPSDYKESAPPPADLISSSLVSAKGGKEVGTGKLSCSYQNTGPIERLASELKMNASQFVSAETINCHRNIFECDLSSTLMSWLLGTAFGRWDIRYATGERQPPELPDPFDPLPVCPPGMLQNAEGLPASPKDVPADYPLRISWPGILVDDENHPEDIVARVREAIEVIWKDRAEAIEQEACGILGVPDLRDYFRRPAAFFADHLKRYSKSRRQAPIYWPLSTKSGSYTLWLYYHRLTRDTLYKCLDLVQKKMENDLDPTLLRLRTMLTTDEGGAKERKQLVEAENLLNELKELHAELTHWAPRWNPNLNDGVQITASPLWKLFRLPKWQKTLKETWQKLEKGDYDWAHLAYTLWPARVREKCKKDRSLAIAHDLEALCEVKPPAP